MMVLCPVSLLFPLVCLLLASLPLLLVLWLLSELLLPLLLLLLLLPLVASLLDLPSLLGCVSSSVVDSSLRPFRPSEE